MTTNLGERVFSECAGVYMSSEAHHIMGHDNTLFGVENQAIIEICSPQHLIPESSSAFQSLPEILQKAIRDPDGTGRDLWKTDKLFFFHYAVDRQRYEEVAKNYPTPIDLKSKEFERVFGPRDQETSCIKTNFFSDTLYVGKTEVLGQVVEQLKRGGNIEELLLSIVRGSLARSSQQEYVRRMIGKYNDLHVFDSVKEPAYVGLTREK